MVGGLFDTVQVDVIPADFYSCYIILSHRGGGLLRVSDGAPEQQRQQQQESRCHVDVRPSALTCPGSNSVPALVLLFRLGLFKGRGCEAARGGGSVWARLRASSAVIRLYCYWVIKLPETQQVKKSLYNTPKPIML